MLRCCHDLGLLAFFLVDEDQIRDLPLNGRNYTDLVFLQPGAVAFPYRDGGSVVAHLRLGPCRSPLIIPGTGHMLLAMERLEGLRKPEE
mgnify:CR=1 FL=1